MVEEKIPSHSPFLSSELQSGAQSGRDAKPGHKKQEVILELVEI
jgi:hypothetical protein